MVYNLKKTLQNSSGTAYASTSARITKAGTNSRVKLYSSLGQLQNDDGITSTDSNGLLDVWVADPNAVDISLYNSQRVFLGSAKGIVPEDNVDIASSSGGGGGGGGGSSARDTLDEGLFNTGVNASVPIVGTYVQGADTDVGYSLVPLGSGPLLGAIPDGTGSGGNVRGAYAVDFQLDRNNTPTAVASGDHSVVVGGEQNTASQIYSAALSGQNNTAEGYWAFIGGGQNNVSSGNTSTVSGGLGNVASGDYSFIGGGDGNTLHNLNGVLAGGNGNTVDNTGQSGAVLVGGSSNYLHSSAILGFIGGGGANTLFDSIGIIIGGSNNTVNSGSSGGIIIGGSSNSIGTGAAAGLIVTGSGNTVTGLGSSIINGQNIDMSGENSVALGGIKATDGGSAGCVVFGPLLNPTVGTQATGQFQWASQGICTITTDATPTVMLSGTSTTGTGLILLADSVSKFKASVIGMNVSTQDCASFDITGVIKRGSLVSQVSFVGTPTVTAGPADSGASTWTCVASLDTSVGQLVFTVTGQASTTIDWMARVDAVQVY